jgi:hypothetical protein
MNVPAIRLESFQALAIRFRDQSPSNGHARPNLAVAALQNLEPSLPTLEVVFVSWSRREFGQAPITYDWCISRSVHLLPGKADTYDKSQ